ncbi:MAG: hypothetical protein GKR88_04690 [Flavobacteriaceae bacterium]|nr:MAG: hypothetical protein GKR88_04690 [Flavobacteriaceae bacterium]
MNTLWKLLQYGYLVVAAIFLIEAVLTFNKNRSKAYMMFGFAIFILLIFFFKRHFRKKIEKRNAQK